MRLAALATFLCGACSAADDCIPGTYRCRGDAAENCIEDQDLGRGRWRATPCEDLTCVGDTMAHRSYCAETARPEAGCVASPGAEERLVCDGARLLLCTPAGYLLDHEDCGACIADAEPFCAESAAPEPACTGAESACSGDTIVFCHRGYRVRHYLCPDAGGCHDPKAGLFAFCALAADPKCPAPVSEGRSAYCEGSASVSCIDGYAVWRQTCIEGPVSPACGTAPDGSEGMCANGASGEQGTPGGQPRHD